MTSSVCKLCKMTSQCNMTSSCTFLGNRASQHSIPSNMTS